MKLIAATGRCLAVTGARECRPVLARAAGILAVFATLFGPAWSSEPESGKTAPADSPTLWVSSIAPIGDGQCMVGIADGLLLRPSKVVRMSFADLGDLEPQLAAEPLYEHDAAVWCVAATSDHRQVASLDYRGNLGTYEVGTGKSTVHKNAGKRWCQALTASPDDQSWVFGNEAGELFVWSIAESKPVQSITVSESSVTSLSFSPDGRYLAISDGSGNLKLMSWPKLEEVSKVSVGKGAAWSVLFFADDQVIVGSNDRKAYSVAISESGETSPPTVLLKATDWVTQLLAVGSEVYAGEVSGKVHRLRLGGSDPMRAPSGVWALAVTDDGSVVAGTRRHGMAGLTAIAPAVTPDPVAETDPEAESSEPESDPAPEEKEADDSE